MTADLQAVPESQPPVFNYSLDWRFLLPMSDSADILVLDGDNDFAETLERVGIPAPSMTFFLDPGPGEGNIFQSMVVPFGLPMRLVGPRQVDQIEFFRSARRLIRSNGNLLVGFENSWNPRSSLRSRYHPSMPRRLTSQLHRAGFNSIKIFGAIPNLAIPEYIFDLQSQALYYALHHRFRRKRVMSMILQLLSNTIGLAGISNFMPCYFAVARA